MAYRKRLGLTRIELLVLLVLMAFLSGLRLPACQRVHDSENRTQTLNSLKQVGLSIQSANDVWKRLPPAWGEFPPRGDASEPQSSARATLHVWLLPFLEEDRLLYGRLTQTPPKGENDDATRRVWRLPLTSKVVAPYIALSDFTSSDGTVMLDARVYGVQNFAANIRVFGPLAGDGAQPGVEPASDAFDGVASIPKSFPDGTSNTITFATRYAQCGSGGSTWSQIGSATLGAFGGSGAFFGSNISATLNAGGDNASGDNVTFQVAPRPQLCNPIYAQSFGTGGIQVVLGDCSVRMIAPTISMRTWARAVIPSDGFVLDNDWDP